MIFFKKKRVELGDGHIIAYIIFEHKLLFSIIVYNWKTIKQNRFHSHAFGSVAFLLRGSYVEERIVDGRIITNNINKILKPRILPRNYIHKIMKAEEKTWTIIFVGPWIKYWFEYFSDSKTWIKYGWGRKVVEKYNVDETFDITKDNF